MRAAALISVLFGIALSICPAADTAKYLDIPAGELTTALEVLARQSQVELIYSREQLAGLRTAGVHGDLTAKDAVTQLLQGTGLVVKVHPSGALLITRSPIKKPATPPAKAPPPGQRRNSTSEEKSLAEVLVTASRRPEPVTQVPGGVAVITGAELDALGARSLEDYVNFLPGLGIQSYGHFGFDSVFIRGIAPQSVGATIATYVDEIPIGPAGAASTGGEFAIDFDPWDLERIEVLKGPQGTLYGASSMGGVLKYVTRAPDLTHAELHVAEDVSITQEGAPGQRVSGAWSVPLIEGQLALRLSSFYEHVGGYIDDSGAGGKNTNRANNRGLRASVLFAPDESLSWRVTALNQVNASHGNNIVDYDLATGRPVNGTYSQFRYLAEPARTQLDLYYSDLRYRFRGLELIAASSYSRLRPRAWSDVTVGLEEAGFSFVTPRAPVALLQDDPADQITQELRLTSQRPGRLDWMLGVFFQHESLYYESMYSVANAPLPGPPLGDAHRSGSLTEWAGFADATLHLLPTFDVTAGLRDSEISQTLRRRVSGALANPDDPTAIVRTYQGFTENAPTYLLALRWRPSDSLMIYGRAASGYRPGGGRGTPIGAPANFQNYYTSDSLRSYETGVKTQLLQDRLDIDFAAFWIDWTRIQTLQYFGANDVDGNAGTALSRGMELQVNARPAEHLQLTLDSAYADAHFTQTDPTIPVTAGEPLFYVPKWTAALRAGYSYPIGRAWQALAAADFQYESARLDINGTNLRSYALWDARIGARNSLFRVDLYVKNLTNKQALLGSFADTNSSPYGFVVNAPRTVGLSFTQDLH
jgi:outer membrane receptor protein involved in Fe transport